LSTVWKLNKPTLTTMKSIYDASGLDVVQATDVVMDDFQIVVSVLVKLGENDSTRLGNRIIVLGKN
jgi:hypothetical protein